MQHRIVLSERMSASLPSLREDYPNLQFSTVPFEGPVKDEYLECDVLWRSALSDDIFNAILTRNDSLKWVHLTTAGFDWILREELTRRVQAGLQVTRSANSFNVSIAEFVLASMFSSARFFPELHAAQAEERWITPDAIELGLSTVTILGTGAIGQEVAWRCRALGSTVIGVSRSGEPVGHFDEVHTQEAIDDLLPSTDFLVVAVPLTHETREMIGARELALMPETAVVINVGRGAVIDNDALVDALNSSTIASAVIDVFEEEPLPVGHKLWRVPNLFATPHTSFRGRGNAQRLELDFRTNLDLFLAGKPLQGTMKAPELGY